MRNRTFILFAIGMLFLPLLACAAPQASPSPTSAATAIPAPTAAAKQTAAPAAPAAPAPATAVVAPTAVAPAPAAAVPATAVPAATGISIVDDAGRTVRLARPAARVISLAPSNTELVYAVAGGDVVVAVDDFSNYPAEAPNKPKVGSFAKINLEKVVSLTPDLVLATEIHVKDVAPALEKLGLTVAIVQPKNAAAVLASIKMVGTLTGKNERAAELAATLERRFKAVQDRTASAKSKPRVYFELDPALYTVGPSTFIDDLIVKAGGLNIAADAKTAWPQLTEEALILKDPEVILLSDGVMGETPEKVKARRGWGVIAAVKNNRVIVVDPDFVSRPGPRVFDGLEEMARLLQPEQGR